MPPSCSTLHGTAALKAGAQNCGAVPPPPGLRLAAANHGVFRVADATGRAAQVTCPGHPEALVLVATPDGGWVMPCASGALRFGRGLDVVADAPLIEGADLLSGLSAADWLEDGALIAGTLGDPLHLPLFLLLVTQASDVLQYAWGKLLGRRPIAPRLSPSKTLEGTLGGLLSAVALGAALAPLTPFSPAGAAGVSLLLTLLGFAGGLSLSAIKRRRGIKDWGTLIPGHGGLLDRLDSLYLSAPAFYYLLRFGGIS